MVFQEIVDGVVDHDVLILGLGLTVSGVVDGGAAEVETPEALTDDAVFDRAGGQPRFDADAKFAGELFVPPLKQTTDLIGGPQ